jgi:hypothetical protein
MPFRAFQPLKPAPGGPATIFPWGRQQGLLASYVRLSIYILGSHIGTLSIGVTNNLWHDRDPAPRLSYSSRNVLAGSIPAIRSVGTMVAMMVIDASRITTVRMVGAS